MFLNFEFSLLPLCIFTLVLSQEITLKNRIMKRIFQRKMYLSILLPTLGGIILP